MWGGLKYRSWRGDGELPGRRWMGAIIPGNDSCQVSGERLSLPLTEGTWEEGGTNRKLSLYILRGA